MSELTREHSDFREMKDRWEMCEDAAEGEYAVHAAREKYLPRLTEEDDKDYNLRVKMTPFFNATWRTIVGMRGMMFRKPPTVIAPPALMDLMENIDLSGLTMEGLASEVVEEALTTGRIGLLVDYPVVPVGSTLADAHAANARPMVVLYEACSIYNWVETKVNGRKILQQVRLIEEVEVQDPEDEFKVTEEKRYRILDLVEGIYRQRLFKVDDLGTKVQIGEDIFPKMNNQPMRFIPFLCLSVDCTGMDVDAPPLIDLVTTNFHHYMQATSYERGCFFSGLPTLFIFGMEKEDDEISIGGSTANVIGNPNAKAEFVEVTSKFEALRTNLEDKKREMAVLGARMLEGGKNAGGVEAAETVARRQSGEESVLASMSSTISRGLTVVLQWVADWAGISGGVSYKLNKDFLPQSMTAQDMSALVAAWQSGAISQETLFNNLKQGEIISNDDDFETEQERINAAQAQFAAQTEAQAAADRQDQLDMAAAQQALSQEAQNGM